MRACGLQVAFTRFERVCNYNPKGPCTQIVATLGLQVVPAPKQGLITSRPEYVRCFRHLLQASMLGPRCFRRRRFVSV